MENSNIEHKVLDGRKRPSRIRQWLMLLFSFFLIFLFIGTLGFVIKPWLKENSSMMNKMYNTIEQRDINTAGYDYTDTEQTPHKDFYFDVLEGTKKKNTVYHILGVVFCITILWVGFKYMPLD